MFRSESTEQLVEMARGARAKGDAIWQLLTVAASAVVTTSHWIGFQTRLKEQVKLVCASKGDEKEVNSTLGTYLSNLRSYFVPSPATMRQMQTAGIGDIQGVWSEEKAIEEYQEMFLLELEIEEWPNLLGVSKSRYVKAKASLARCLKAMIAPEVTLEDIPLSPKENRVYQESLDSSETLAHKQSRDDIISETLQVVHDKALEFETLEEFIELLNQDGGMKSILGFVSHEGAPVEKVLAAIID